MSFRVKQFRVEIVERVLKWLDEVDPGIYSTSAVELVVGTAAHESELGHSLKQVGGGPALGIYQMEPATHDDIWNSWLVHKPRLAVLVDDLGTNALSDDGNEQPAALDMVGNLWYATAMCRCHYRRVREPLPSAGDLHAQARYWKKHYNTPKGKGTVKDFIKNFPNQLIGRR